MNFPIKNGGSFHSYVNVYQRVNCIVIPLFTIVNHRKSPFIVVKSPFSYGFPMVYHHLSPCVHGFFGTYRVTRNSASCAASSKGCVKRPQSQSRRIRQKGQWWSYKQIWLYVHIYIHKYNKYVYIYMYVYIYNLYIYVCVYIYIHILLYIYVCMRIYIYAYMCKFSQPIYSSYTTGL